MPLDSGAIASQVGASRGLWTHTPVDWRGNEPPGTAQPGGWPPNASDATAVTVNFTLSQSATNQVEYGTTTAYGLSNTEGSGTGAQTKALAGLTTVTLYHYRIRATVNNLNTYSADRTFTTV
jgi:hypothetical protein